MTMHMTHRHCVAYFLAAALLACGATSIAEPAKMTLEQLRTARKQLAHKPRRIIFNNDGCDVLYFPGKLAVTPENLLGLRTTPLAESQVDAIAYCSISSGFSNFTHHTKAGHVLSVQPALFGLHPEDRNITQDLIDQGADCLELMVRFAHQHKREVFWSMRMNDTHDAEYRPDKPYLLYPKLKMEHPEWLVGDPIKRSKHGRWSSVDYAVPEIRQLALAYIEEVCRNYDVDGVELDFFRHLCYFKSTAHGSKASQAECDMMTDLLKRVRAMSEEQGGRRGRPILVAVRVPDSVEFCRDMGFDIQRWLGDGLVDMLITTCYFRLNPWSYSVELGHKYGVPVYPCVSDSRVLGGERFSRSSVDSYRGQAMNAWAAGADGIHVFNAFDPKSPIWRELGDAKALRGMAKLYFVTVRDGNPNSYLADGVQHRNLEILTPKQPRHITPTQPMRVPIEIGDDPAWAKDSGHAPRVTCHLWLPRLLHPDGVAVSINGKPLATGKLAKGWLDCPVGQGGWKRGENLVEVAANPSLAPQDDQWSFEYVAKKLPAKPWTRDHGSPRTQEKLVDGGLLIADRGTENGDYHYYRYPWGASPDSPLVVEARVKAVSGISRVILTNGAAQVRLELTPASVHLWNKAGKPYAMNTTDDFHLYRIETRGADVKVYVDGTLRIDAPGAFKPRADTRINQLCFGAASSTEVGEACWALVRARLANQVCQDVVVSVEPEERKPE